MKLSDIRKACHTLNEHNTIPPSTLEIADYGLLSYLAPDTTKSLKITTLFGMEVKTDEKLKPNQVRFVYDHGPAYEFEF